jgi:hypothetical protein
MGVPSTIRAGDTVQWVEAATTDLAGDPLTSADWTATAYLRTNTNAEGATVVGVARADGGWDFTITAATTTGFDAGRWFWQIQAVNGTTVQTLGAGTFDVLAALSYTSTPAAFDGRSQAEVDLAAVQAAIRAIVSRGAQQYSIGSRSYSALNLKELMQRETQLKAQVARERKSEKIAAGLGDPHSLYVRFT